MKATIKVLVVAVFVLALLTGLRSSGSLHHISKVYAASGCSLQTIQGTYGFYRSGTAPLSGVDGPLGAVGVVTFDGHGGSSFSQTIVKSGTETSDLFTGGATAANYSVNSDCTGEFLLDGSPFGHAVIVGGGDELFFISLTPGNTVTGVMRRISPEHED